MLRVRQDIGKILQNPAWILRQKEYQKIDGPCTDPAKYPEGIMPVFPLDQGQPQRKKDEQGEIGHTQHG